LNLKQKLIIGTRKSELALWQAEFVKRELLKEYKNLKVELKLISTKGDKILNKSLSKIGDKGLFTKELENYLLNGEIDIAVHSLKDMETTLPKNLILAAVTKRHNPQDVLIARKKNMTIDKLPENATVATGSLRRKSQLKHLRPDIKVVDLRGNVPTRIQKFLESDWDAIILACAGVERLKLKKHISSYISTDELIPAAGQGALGIEVNSKNKFALESVKFLNDENSFYSTLAERALLNTLQGGCQVPVGVFAEVKSNGLYLDAIVGSLNGDITFRKKIRGAKKNAIQLGTSLAKDLLNAGAKEILNKLKKNIV